MNLDGKLLQLLWLQELLMGGWGVHYEGCVA